MAIKINFEKIIEKAKQEYSSKQKSYIMSSIELARKYILDYIKENPETSPEDLKLDILDDLYGDSQEFAAISNLRNEVFRYEIINILMKDSKQFEELYYKLKDEQRKFDEDRYFVDRAFEKRKEDFVRECIVLLNEFNDTNKDLIDMIHKYYQGDKVARELINEKRNKMSPIQRKKLDEQIKNINDGDLAILKTFLPDTKEELENSLKKTYIKILSFIGNFLEKNGLLDKYIQRNNQQLTNIGLSILGINKNKFKEKSILNEDFLEQLDFEELPIMTAFWLNRYTKENQTLNNGIFTINALGLWDYILEGKTEFNITEEQFRAIYCKTEFLKTVNQKIIESINEKINNNTATVIEKVDDVAVVNVEAELDEIEEIVRVKYYDEFEGVLPNSYTQIMEDLKIYMPLTSNTANAYSHKNEIIATQMLSYMRSNRIRNWGYIKDNENQNDNMIIIGIDYEGYNMPVKLHMHKEQVIQVLKEAEMEPIIPLYEGDEDFRIGGKMLKSHIINPITREQGNEIKRLLVEDKRGVKVLNLLEHFNFLRDSSKYPKHLMQPIVKKEKVTFVRPPRKYINLETNEIFIKEQNGSLKKLTDKEEKSKV